MAPHPAYCSLSMIICNSDEATFEPSTFRKRCVEIPINAAANPLRPS